MSGFRTLILCTQSLIHFWQTHFRVKVLICEQLFINIFFLQSLQGSQPSSLGITKINTENVRMVILWFCALHLL